jgi:hypothetical protein
LVIVEQTFLAIALKLMPSAEHADAGASGDKCGEVLPDAVCASPDLRPAV